MAIGQRGNTVVIMAFAAEFLGCLFVGYLVETLVGVVMG